MECPALVEGGAFAGATIMDERLNYEKGDLGLTVASSGEIRVSVETVVRT